jgi:hypothetical protein
VLTRTGRIGLAAAGIAVVLAVGGYGIAQLTHHAKSETLPTCTAGDYDIDTDQASVAAQMIGEVYQYRIAHPDRAGVLVLAAALQESKLANLAPGEGDRDSVGVLQQRPSQGWGSSTTGDDSTAARERRLNDVTEATREFLRKLPDTPSWWTLPAAEAIQNIQVSADGSLYAQHEPEATALSAALLGSTAAGLTCTFAAPTAVAKPSVIVTDLGHQLGLTTPVASATGVSVPGAGWQTASWLVANADKYGIASVDFAARTWTRDKGWAASSAPAGRVTATMATLKN